MSKILLTVITLAMLTAAGCAKKQKPDLDTTAGNAGTIDPGQIENKDMSFSLQGSDSGQIAGLYTVHFAYDKSNLTAETRDLLAKNAEWLKQHPDETLQIEGHCDRHGSIEYNLALGERRAKMVKAYMENLGVASDRLSTISYGKEKPVDSGETEDADAKNRRANFHPATSTAVTPLSQR